jgi:hypothetical protein
MDTATTTTRRATPRNRGKLSILQKDHDGPRTSNDAEPIISPDLRDKPRRPVIQTLGIRANPLRCSRSSSSTVMECSSTAND